MSDDHRTDVVRMPDGRTLCYSWIVKKLCFCCISEESSRNFNITVDGDERTLYITAQSFPGYKRINFSMSSAEASVAMNLKLKYSILNRRGILTNTVEYEDWTNHYAVSYDSLEKPCELISNDNYSLTLVVEVTSQRISKFQANALESRLPNDLQLLFHNEKFSDLTIVVEQQEFRVHKAMLASRSPVFLAMLENDMVEKQNNRVEIDDIDYETMKHVLLYVYTGKVENIELLASKLLGPADKYALDGLKDICVEVLSDALTVDNAFETLKMADLYRVSKLETSVLEYVAKRFKDIDTEELKSRFKSLMKSQTSFDGVQKLLEAL